MLRSNSSRLLHKILTLFLLIGCLAFASYNSPVITEVKAGDPWEDFFGCNNAFDSGVTACYSAYYNCMTLATTDGERAQCGINLGGCGGSAVVAYSGCLDDVEDLQAECPPRHAAADLCSSELMACGQMEADSGEFLDCYGAYQLCIQPTRIWECE